MTFSRIGGWAAIGFAALLVGGNLVLAPAGPPLIGAPAEEVADFFGDQSGIVRLTSAIGPFVWLLATVFGAAATAALWPIERRRGEAWSLVGFAGLLLQNTTFLGVIATRLALTGTAADASATQGLWSLNEAFFALNGTFLATAMIGLSLAGLRTRLIRRSHAVLGFAAAGLQFASAVLLSLAFDDPGPIDLLGLAGWLLWVVWIAWYGIVLIRLRASSADPIRTAEPAAT
ncbi:hypothetical protein [Actinomadura sp. KC216]|uniref:hypothetical protein n=1 Tax=Actinomadura sp. KC216 TaxID=2530370 RepID=UPI001A9FE10D|nr:hypothetical protein [Actinomadura sp. KC216]